LSAVQSSLDAGDDPAAIIDACEEGMRLVGARYEQYEYYLSGLIMAGEIFRAVLEITRPAPEASLAGIGAGKKEEVR
jgi:dimethylamine corrinoid protein